MRQFARAPDGASFDALAADIARYQSRHNPAFRRLVEAHGARLDSARTIPAVPVEAFRLARVAVHPPSDDVARFVTSGTTRSSTGVHPMRTTETYRELALSAGAEALSGGGAGPRVVVALAPPPGDKPSSSLAFMMRAFMQAFDGRSLDPRRPFDADAPERWLLGSSGVDVAGLERALHVALERGEPLLVLATSFALVYLLDALGSRQLAVPVATVVMQTGGFKGRTREIEPRELVDRVAGAFRIEPQQVVGEYGMTELTSQLYQAPRREVGIYYPPAWLAVDAVDPETLQPRTEGEPGIARFVDLGNVDSAVAIVTEDVVIRRAGGIELVGRRLGAPARGCSLAVEQMVLAGGTRSAP